MYGNIISRIIITCTIHTNIYTCVHNIEIDYRKATFRLSISLSIYRTLSLSLFLNISHQWMAIIKYSVSFCDWKGAYMCFTYSTNHWLSEVASKRCRHTLHICAFCLSSFLNYLCVSLENSILNSLIFEQFNSFTFVRSVNSSHLVTCWKLISPNI